MLLLGRPADRAVHEAAGVLGAVDAAAAVGLVPVAAAFTGKTYATPPRRGWAATAKPKSAGRPSPISVQFAPASSLR